MRTRGATPAGPCRGSSGQSLGWSLAVTLCSRSATTRLFMGTEAGAQGIMNLTNCVTILVSFIHMCCYVCLVFFYV